jgi:hypothetical protein
MPGILQNPCVLSELRIAVAHGLTVIVGPPYD